MSENRDAAIRDLKISFYKSIFINVVCALEFFDVEMYPQSPHFKNLASYIANHIDQYNDIFEAIYEKYKTYNMDAIFTPEMRLLFKTVTDCLINYLTNVLFKPQDSTTMRNIFNNLDNTDYFTQHSK